MKLRRTLIAGMAGGGLLVVALPVILVVASAGSTTAQCGTQTATPVIAGDLGTFLGAIRTHESGGNYTAQNGTSTASGAYQFISSTWQSEAKAAGVTGYPPRAADAPPAMQDTVAAFMATNLWNATHDWGLVAGAWFIGHPPTPAEMDIAPPGNGGLTPRIYAQQIAALMAGGSATAPTTAPANAACPNAQLISSTSPGVAGYINPIQPGMWGPARTDQGIDWLPTVDGQPIMAIGDGLITYSNPASGWPFDYTNRGGGFIVVQLTAGPKSGLRYYVSEHIINLAPVGTIVKAGDVIAQALVGYAFTEWGWAAASGDLPCPVCQYNGAPDGTPTVGGQMFTRFMQELGAATLMNPGPGPDAP